MKPSQTCIDFIKREEHCLLKAYLDIAGVWTIGWGSTMYTNGKKIQKGDTITQAYADALLQWEVDNKSRSVAAFTKNVVLTQNQFDALTSFAYNCGVGALEKSTLLKKVIRNPNDQKMINLADAVPDVQHWMHRQGMKDINTIHHEFMKWVKVTKDGRRVIALGLQKRRQREWNLYAKTTA